MIKRWVSVAALALVLSPSPTVAADSTSYPQTPANPRTAAECVALAQDYNRVRALLLQHYDNLGMGRGPQVAAGPCCKQTAASPGWCRTFQSHAAVWEAIQCADIAKDKATAACNRAVAIADTQANLSLDDVGPYVKTAAALSGRNELETAEKLLKVLSIGEELRSWATVGNSTAELQGLVQNSAERAISFDGTIPFVLDSEKKRLKYVSIANAVIREWAARMLNSAGIIHTDVVRAFNERMNTLEREFPGIARGATPATSLPLTNAGPATPAGGNCRDAIERKIGECDVVAAKDPQRRANDFSFYQRCRARYADELAHCR